MNCKQIETRLIDYLDGKLAARERQAIELHAQTCAACLERIQGFSRVFSSLDAWEEIQPSASFNTRLQERIEAGLAPSSWWSNLFAHLMPLPARNGVFALALLLIVSVGAVLVQYSPVPASTRASGQQSSLAAATAGGDDATTYRDLPVLQDVDVLRNFEALQEMDGTQ